MKIKINDNNPDFYQYCRRSGLIDFKQHVIRNFSYLHFRYYRGIKDHSLTGSYLRPNARLRLARIHGTSNYFSHENVPFCMDRLEDGIRNFFVEMFCYSVAAFFFNSAINPGSVR